MRDLSGAVSYFPWLLHFWSGGDSLESNLLAIWGAASVRTWQLGPGLRWLKQLDRGEVGQVGQAGKSMPYACLLCWPWLFFATLTTEMGSSNWAAPREVVQTLLPQGQVDCSIGSMDICSRTYRAERRLAGWFLHQPSGWLLHQPNGWFLHQPNERPRLSNFTLAWRV